ncbi:hypothetical protein P7H75_05940 [Vagococcus carniphilus]|nr:hypothetical protein [Vagococcus carniphilus]MDT2814381.1 hypothetical protein [Vagococcus carniphilus]
MIKRSDKHKKASEKRNQKLALVLAILTIIEKLIDVIQKLIN